jgi:release factor glutamine methyltransferase
VEAASGRDGAELWDALGDPVPERARRRLAEMTARRRGGEPLQYVTGSWGFRRLDLMVDRRVLIPRPETEVVVEVALAELRRLARPRPVVVDLGTGSGAIALALADEGPEADIWATDVSAPALEVATANLAGLGGRAAPRVRLARGSWFCALPGELAGRVDLVVSNPPYVAEADEVEPEVAGWEPADALWSGPGGLEATDAILAEAPRWLARPGAVVLEVAAARAGETAARAEAAGLAVSLHPDLAGRDRVLVGRLECP